MNLETTQNINLDFYKTKMITVDAKQYDKSSRYLLISCYNQGTFFKFNNSSHSVYVRYKKPDEYPVFNSCSITDDGNILIELTEQMLSVPGICSADLIIVNKSNISSDKEAVITDDNDLKNILSTMKFYVNVIPTPFQNSEIESSYEFDALNELLIKANEDYTYIINTVTSIAETTKSYKTDAENYSLQSKSYAVGTKDEIRENDSVDNAKYYFEQAKRISQGLEGSLLPMGTIPSSQISTTLKQPGYMYNISDDFITDDTFKEGAGHSYSAGTNIYYTADGYWDCLAGTNVVGVKGDAESEYRTGLINITSQDIGAVSSDGDASNTTVNFEQSGTNTRENIASGEKLSVIFKKIRKWFSDLKDAAFYNVVNNVTQTEAGQAVLDAAVGKWLDEHKLDKDNVIESTEITEPGFVMDGKTASEEFAKINSNFTSEKGRKDIPSGSNTKVYTSPPLEKGLYSINASGAYDVSSSSSITMTININNTAASAVRTTMSGGGQMSLSYLANLSDDDKIGLLTYHANTAASPFKYEVAYIKLR